MKVSDNAGSVLGPIFGRERIPTPATKPTCAVCDDAGIHIMDGLE